MAISLRMYLSYSLYESDITFSSLDFKLTRESSEQICSMASAPPIEIMSYMIDITLEIYSRRKFSFVLRILIKSLSSP